MSYFDPSSSYFYRFLEQFEIRCVLARTVTASPQLQLCGYCSSHVVKPMPFFFITWQSCALPVSTSHNMNEGLDFGGHRWYLRGQK